MLGLSNGVKRVEAYYSGDILILIMKWRVAWNLLDLVIHIGGCISSTLKAISASSGEPMADEVKKGSGLALRQLFDRRT
jgi:hypothetical protein